MVFPIEHGLIQAQLADASTCFNLNSVAEGAGDLLQRRERGAREFDTLLRELGIPAHRSAALVDALVDWIDSDQVRSSVGAEDRDYHGYGTAGTLLAGPSELRAIAGYDEATYARLRPFVCALPEARPLAININALDPRHAPLLGMLTGGAIDAAAARRVLAARPAGGWQDTADFWSLPALSGVAETARGTIGVRGSVFELRAQVSQGDALLEMSALLQVEGSDGARLLARRWSEPE